MLVTSLKARFMALLLSVLLCCFPFYSQNFEQMKKDKQDQIQRVSKMESDYATGIRTKKDEATFFKGDLNAELKNGIKLNEVSFMATHNSYQTKKAHAATRFYNFGHGVTFDVLHDKSRFDSPPLSEQFDNGYRSIEIDVEPINQNGKTEFLCMHKPVWDMTTNSYSFTLALREIKIWSEHNKNHLPISVIIEPKFGGWLLKDMDYFNLDYLKILDKTVRDELGDILLTPKDVMDSYQSLRDMRLNDGWPELKDTLGKVMVILHKCAETENYISLDKTLKSQSMFPSFYLEDITRDEAAVIIANNPESAMKQKALIDKERCLIRTRTDDYSTVKYTQRMAAFSLGASFISTDFPKFSGRDNLTSVLKHIKSNKTDIEKLKQQFYPAVFSCNFFKTMLK